MAATSAWGEMDAMVKPYGFKNFKDWFDDTISLATAYAFAATVLRWTPEWRKP
jgi:hypothetical protein